MRDLVCHAAEFLLRNQWVRGRAHVANVGDGAYRCVKGSGMGFIHSGDVSDTCFLQLVDKWICRDPIRRAYGVSLYLRFRDDGLVLLRTNRIDQFFSTAQAKSRYFSVTEDDVSPYWTTFLNLRVIKAQGRLMTMHYRKPSSRNLALSSL